jgi:glycosyltransferase involved in cell wall biosynthesis
MTPIKSPRGTLAKPSVLVDLTRLKHLHCGLGQLSLHLGRALARSPSQQLSLEFLLPRRNHQLLSSFELPHKIAYPWMKEVFQRRYRQWASRILPRPPQHALWHAASQAVQYLPLDPRIPVLLTIHDLNFLREKPPQARSRRLHRLQALVDRAAAVATGSRFVAGEIQAHLELRGKPLRVIYNGLIYEEHPEAAPPAFADDKPFLFTIGEIAPKKNFHVLLDLLARLPHFRLIVAGNDRTAYAKELRRLAAKKGLAERVVLPGIVSDECRHWLYKNCDAFLFPSLTEGFGLPVIEAMRFGKPVFLSTATSLPEVGGKLACYWTSFDPDAMAAAFRAGMAEFAADPSRALESAAHAKRFSWDKAASEYLAFYSEVLGRIEVSESRKVA